MVIGPIYREVPCLITSKPPISAFICVHPRLKNLPQAQSFPRMSRIGADTIRISGHKCTSVVKRLTTVLFAIL
jgi:hypothetical protein